MAISISIRRWIYLITAQLPRDSRLRGPAAVLTLFCAVFTAAPQAAAQACGSSLNLRANQWTMVGIPCVPPAAKRTVGDVFGPSLGVENYGVTWIAWKRLYDDTACHVPSGPADCYTKLTLASTATTGDTFWIYTTQRRSLQFSSTTTSTPGPYFDIPAQLSSDGNSRYYMFSNPYSSTVRWRRMLFPAVVSGSPTVLTVQQAIGYSIVSKNVHYWNGNTYFTRDLNSPQATFRAKQGAWLEMLEPDAVVSAPVSIRVTKP